MSKEFVCIACPNSCRLTVSEKDGEITVTGNDCKRGIDHGISEYKNPLRMITSTVAILGGTLPRLPVIGTGEIPKTRMNDCLDEIYGVSVSAPIKRGEIIIQNIKDTGVDIVASRSMNKKER